jgi:hypothetical protein
MSAWLVRCVLAAMLAATWPVFAEEERGAPVNVVVETGMEVGPCPEGATLAYPPAAFKGSPYFGLRAEAGLLQQHLRATAKEPEWLRELTGPSSPNRLYIDKAGERALVFESCKERACDGNGAYAAYSLSAKTYWLKVSDARGTRSLGTESAVARAAVECAMAIDARLRSDTRKALGKALKDR